MRSRAGPEWLAHAQCRCAVDGVDVWHNFLCNRSRSCTVIKRNLVNNSLHPVPWFRSRAIFAFTELGGGQFGAKLLPLALLAGRLMFCDWSQQAYATHRHLAVTRRSSEPQLPVIAEGFPEVQQSESSF